MIVTATVLGLDGLPRCRWCSAAPEFHEYHDKEWGFPVADDKRLFEKLCLEGFQSGLSWRTILAKRPHFRKVFHEFDFHLLANFDEQDVVRLLGDRGIVRHRGKIEAVINNAKKAVDLVAAEGSFAAFVWRFEPVATANGLPQTASTSPEAVALSKALKQLGWRFVGPTTTYAFMQAMGLINDHALGCVIRERVAEQRATFAPPGR
ncbi:DNA-3-methyladenine glycosylase I [Chitinimonas sp.]|uniref:DNA-3-methyladenine glycosylase I n=1 Tax=Chitinimonas sp. TaxID=1934313 RepID=UPI002F947A42